VIEKTQQKMKTQELDAASQKLVVIGGGVAGSTLARSLQFHADVTLIDPYSFSLEFKQISPLSCVGLITILLT
jgi:NADPH-dependent 2,4-dienoyl-CoA reductase/sulfur reductase-like enzyme